MFQKPASSCLSGYDSITPIFQGVHRATALSNRDRRILSRAVDRYSVVCPSFLIISYTVHKHEMCTLDIDRTHRQGSGYLKLNTPFPPGQVFRGEACEEIK